MIPMAQLSQVKQFAMATLQCFDNLAQPEINNRVMRKIWEYVRNYTYKIILKKNDSELKEKLKEVYVTLGPMFNDVDMSRQIAEGEKLGSPQIPRVGELAKIKDLTVNQTDLLKELGY